MLVNEVLKLFPGVITTLLNDDRWYFAFVPALKSLAKVPEQYSFHIILVDSTLINFFTFLFIGDL